tara:strand:+ start:1076 stop:1276 length:201 start_codon:yes stop_codon:yes gene_type:complete
MTFQYNHAPLAPPASPVAQESDRSPWTIEISDEFWEFIGGHRTKVAHIKRDRLTGGSCDVRCSTST